MSTPLFVEFKRQPDGIANIEFSSGENQASCEFVPRATGLPDNPKEKKESRGRGGKMGKRDGNEVTQEKREMSASRICNKGGCDVKNRVEGQSL
uniref:Uncharacterized protein n=1 Tax=Vespula pensylvanica TaxID=30213 RepID=A0A834UFH7_VESPE|nr:hypothetical protein H0235_003858 [Vespula pensylvanica]